jgi:pyruvate formate lyase activating enzyme
VSVKVRSNPSGRLQVPWGYVGGVQCDPIEKKPFFHVYPGSLAYSFGMLGCDLHCSYCQNLVASQALRDPAAVSPLRSATPETMVDDALRLDAGVLVSTYNEPLVAAEWAVEIFKTAKQAGLITGFVSNGNETPRALDFLRPWTDLFKKVDLKSFDDRQYRQLGGRLAPILDTIRWLYALDLWVETVTLLISGFNDSDDEIMRLTSFIASVSPEIPWHVMEFHPTYRMTDREDTSADMLARASSISRSNGLRFVYAENRPGDVGVLEHTHCPSCQIPVIERFGYESRSYRLTADGRCPSCGTSVPSRWDAAFPGQRSPATLVPLRTGLNGL